MVVGKEMRSGYILDVFWKVGFIEFFNRLNEMKDRN